MRAESTTRDTDYTESKQQLMQMQIKYDQLSVQLSAANALAERRLTDVESLQMTVKEQAKQVVASQKQEMEAMQRVAELETQVDPLRHQAARLQKELDGSKQHTEWLEMQLTEKTKSIQTLRQSVAKQSHDLEDLKMRSAEEMASMKRQLENARLTSKKLESSLIYSKEQIKELQAANVHDEEHFQNELSAQRRLADLYKESAADASARVTELQGLCESLRTKLAEANEALSTENERTKQQVEHLFREQTEAYEKRIEELQIEVNAANAKIQEMEKKKIMSLQTASTIADLSSAAGEAHLAAHGLTPKQMYDHIVELEEALRETQGEKDKLQLYMDRIVKEVQEKAPVIMGLRLEHERAVASHTQMSERLESCMQSLAHSKKKEAQAWSEKETYEKKCSALAQSVDDLSRQVQHLLFRSQEQRLSQSITTPGVVVSENLVVFKDVEELQVRNQQLLTVIRELTERIQKSKKPNDVILDADLPSGPGNARIVISSDSDEEDSDATSSLDRRLVLAKNELQELRAEREQERQMIAAIVKQRDMYRVLLAQADNKFLDDDTNVDTRDNTGNAKNTHNRRSSFDATESRVVRETRADFDDYKKEKNANMKMLQESLDQSRADCSKAKLAQMQAEAEIKCIKERYEVSENRRQETENELVRLRAKLDQLTALILQHEQALANSEAKLETSTTKLQSLGIESAAVQQEVEYLRKHEAQMQQELSSLRLDNTNLLKLMDSTRRMETTREERDRRENEVLVQKVSSLEKKLQDLYEKAEAKEVVTGAKLVTLEQEKKVALIELEQTKIALTSTREQRVRLEEKNTALESTSNLLNKEVALIREQLRKGASAAAAERVAELEVQLRNAQREAQSLLAEKKALTDNITRYKTIADAHEKSLNELSAASETWKQTEELKFQQLKKEHDALNQELQAARSALKEHVAEGNKWREDMDRVESHHKAKLQEALEKEQMLQLQVESSQKEMAIVREEMERLKIDLSQAQENYERELQLHANEVAKAATSRKIMEEESKRHREMDAKLTEMAAKLTSAEKQAQDKIAALQRQLQDSANAKSELTEQNKLLHSQLEHAASQVRRAHEQAMIKDVTKTRSSSGTADGASQHEREVDDLRSVIGFLRRENEISVSKIELAQQEMQRYRTQVFSLESTIERLRGEIKVVSSPPAESSDAMSTGPSASEKRLAQLEQLTLLRESNANLRDENLKNLARLKQEEARSKALEDQIAPLQSSETMLQALVGSLKQEIVTLNESNKRWKQRVDQLVEKYQQIDPVEHEKVCAEKETLTAEVAELKTKQVTLQEELEALRSNEGKSLEEEKTKVENWRKQYDRIKGFAKSWKTKAESFSKQIAEKTTECEAKAALVTEMEVKVKLLEGRVTDLTTEKSSLDSKLASAESSKQDANAATVANFLKERQELQERLEVELKKSTQLKEFNSRLMSGLKALKKENTELKDQATASSAPSGTESTINAGENKSPLPSKPASSASTSVSAPTPPAQSPAKPPMNTIVTKTVDIPTPMNTPVVATTTVQPPLPTTVAPAAVVTNLRATTADVSAVKETVPAPKETATTKETVAPLVKTTAVSTVKTAPAPVTNTTLAPVVKTVPASALVKTTPVLAAIEATSKSAEPDVVTSTTNSQTTMLSSSANTVTSTSTTTATSTPAPAEQKETIEKPQPTAEEKLRLFALQSMKKQVMASKAAAAESSTTTPAKSLISKPVSTPQPPVPAQKTPDDEESKVIRFVSVQLHARNI